MKIHAMVAVVLALSTAPLQAAPLASGVLSFGTSDTITCNGGVACQNVNADNQNIDPDYGDIPGLLDVTIDGDPGTSGVQPGRYWGFDNGYEGLTGVLYSQGNRSSNSGLSVLFTPLGGNTVTVTSFDIAVYNNRTIDTSIMIFDTASAAPLREETFSPITTDAIVTIAGAWSSASGILIAFGPDAYSVGMDNIAFNISGPTPIPLPASALLLLGGLGSLAALRRKRCVS